MACSLWLRWVILHVQLCLACGLSTRTVTAREGQPVKLPCVYNVGRGSDISAMCWGRGMCPISKCTNEIVRTDGRRVTSARSHRYQLRGAITRGDVSLTISDASYEDRGTYCCRVEIPGLFNDIKQNLNLRIAKATTTTATTTTAPPPTTTAPPPLTTAPPPLTTAPPLTTMAPPLTTMAVLPRPTTPPVSPTSDLPTTAPSITTTIFQTTDTSAEDFFVFSTAELVPLTEGSSTTDLIWKEAEEVTTVSIPEEAPTTRMPEPITDSKLQSQEIADNQKQDVKNEIPIVIISVAVASLLLLTLLLALLLANRRFRESQPCCLRGKKQSSDSPQAPEKILSSVERENSLLVLQPIPDGSPGSQEMSHKPEESHI